MFRPSWPRAGDILPAAIRESVYRYSLPLSTRNLRIAFSPLSDTAALVGAAHTANSIFDIWVGGDSTAALTTTFEVLH